jgi:Na+(H+)/acetate symporter ActP
MKTYLSCVGLVVMVVAIVLFSTIANGWVLSILWEWFIVPVFGLPSLSVPTAIGIAIITSMLTSKIAYKDKDKQEMMDNVAALVGVLLSPFITLLFGYIVHLYM